MSRVKPEASYNILSQRKELGFTIPEQTIFVYRYKEGYPFVPYRSRLNKIGTRCNQNNYKERPLKTSSTIVK